MNELIFMECDLCRKKSGSPLLCSSCLHNRAVISHLQEACINLCAALTAKVELNSMYGKFLGSRGSQKD